jgi:hypothetical protein
VPRQQYADGALLTVLTGMAGALLGGFLSVQISERLLLSLRAPSEPPERSD